MEIHLRIYNIEFTACYTCFLVSAMGRGTVAVCLSQHAISINYKSLNFSNKKVTMR